MFIYSYFNWNCVVVESKKAIKTHVTNAEKPRRVRWWKRWTTPLNLRHIHFILLPAKLARNLLYYENNEIFLECGVLTGNSRLPSLYSQHMILLTEITY